MQTERPRISLTLRSGGSTRIDVDVSRLSTFSHHSINFRVAVLTIVLCVCITVRHLRCTQTDSDFM